MDTRHDLVDNADHSSMPTLAELDASLDRSAAEIAAGEAIPLGPVLKRMRETADRIRREHGASGQASTPQA